ncbi:MAG: universal stress protein [Bacteroidota bacterium]
MENNQSVILVPTDFTEVGDMALKHAIGTAKQLGFAITLLHIINSETKAALRKNNLTVANINEKLATTAQQIKKEHNVDTDFISKKGSIFSAISEVAEEVSASMIMMGTHGKKGIQHLIGSYALKVITSVKIPTLVIQKEAEYAGSYKRIVLPIDNSVHTRQKFKWAIFMAKKLNSEIFIIASQESDPFAKRRLANNLGQVEKLLEENKLKFSTKLCEKSGSFGKQLLNYAATVEADLMMIMTSPDQLIPNFIFGPLDDQIIYNKQMIPVLCVNPKDTNIQIVGM